MSDISQGKRPTKRTRADRRTPSPAPSRASSPDIIEVSSASQRAASSKTPQTDSTKARTAAINLSKYNERYKTDTRSPEEVLKEQSSTWHSKYYQHFRPPTVVIEKGVTKYKFVCKTHPSIAITRARHDEATSNLKRHVDACESKIAPDGEAINDFAHGSTYSKAMFRYLLVLWVSRSHRPFVIVQDEDLLRIFRMLYGRVEVPHPTTVSRDTQFVFGQARSEVASYLQKHTGCIHLCIDGWTSPNVISFLGVTIQRVVEGHLEAFTLDFVKLTKAHTGKYLAEKLIECLTEYGILKRILSVACDNASNNDTLLDELEVSLDGRCSKMTRVRCFAHILNLVVKGILSPFAQKLKASSLDTTLATEDSEDEDRLRLDDDDVSGDSGDEDEYELDADAAAADEEDIEAIIAEVEEEYELLEDEQKEGRVALTKLILLAKRVFHSPTLRGDLELCCKKANIEPKQMIRSVPTRWNSLAETIERALYLRVAIDTLTSLSKYDKRGKQGLRHYKLSTSEWAILTQLEDILSIFLEATHIVSQSGIPLLHQVIPLIDSCMAGLEDAISDPSNHQSVRVAAARGIRVINKYYSKTDESIMYRAAMVLHPRFKLEYFRRNKWEPVWIQTSEDIVREQWEKYYKKSSATEGEAETSQSQSSNTATARKRRRHHEDLDNFGIATDDDALTAYLAAPIMSTHLDPMQYWNYRLSEGDPLAQMSLDFLSAPAASTDVERAFSHGGLTVSKRRHALSDQSVRSSTILGSWARVPGLISENNIVAAMKKRSKRTKKTKTPNVYVDISDSDVE